MARPNLAPKRRTEILDAFEICVLEAGLERASLDRVAAAAGFKRQLVLHYFGSRSELVKAAVERMVREYCERIEIHLGGLDEDDRLQELLRWMLRGDFCNPRWDALLGEVKSQARRIPEYAELLEQAYRELENILANLLRRKAPDASAKACRETAFSLIALCYGAGDLLMLGFPQARMNATHRIATNLVAALET